MDSDAIKKMMEDRISSKMKAHASNDINGAQTNLLNELNKMTS
jgi:hypothetical protein